MLIGPDVGCNWNTYYEYDMNAVIGSIFHGKVPWINSRADLNTRRNFGGERYIIFDKIIAAATKNTLLFKWYCIT